MSATSNNLKTEDAELGITISIRRGDTGVVETYSLLGKVTAADTDKLFTENDDERDPLNRGA